ncbi:hypothetical protein GCM10027610_054350 [Dactylosporangium cerinum]
MTGALGADMADELMLLADKRGRLSLAGHVPVGPRTLAVLRAALA